MGVYDRDYMTDSDEAMHAGGRRYTAVLILIVINVLVWVAWQFARSDETAYRFMRDNFTVSRVGLLRDLRLYTLLTSCLSHEGLGHIFFNLLFFWILGDEVERIYGFRNFFWLYAFCGVAASLAFVGLEVAQAQDAPMLGASGAIMGLAVVAAIFNPSRPISIWGLITVPLRVLVIVYIVLDILGALDNRSIVAHSAHLGGALSGYIFWKLDLRVFARPGRSNVGLWFRLRRWLRRKPRLHVVERVPDDASALEPGAPRPSPGRGAHVDEATRKRVDELLGRIARQGLGALTAEEREFLQESSRKYRRN